jgi:hypothetical protein
MAKKTMSAEVGTEPQGGPTLRRCIGSARYSFEAHDAPVEDFPNQPSQKDELGRMCTTHWRQYTAGLARDAKARKAAEAATIEPAAPAPGDGDERRRAADVMTDAVATTARRQKRKPAEAVASVEGDAG